MSAANSKFKQARQKARRSASIFANLIYEYASKHKAPSLDEDRFKDYLGYGRLTDMMMSSDLDLRRKAAHFF